MLELQLAEEFNLLRQNRVFPDQPADCAFFVPFQEKSYCAVDRRSMQGRELRQSFAEISGRDDCTPPIHGLRLVPSTAAKLARLKEPFARIVYRDRRDVRQ